ncbi:cytochrome P450 [Streptosporangium sp. NPDC023825]|uniref:cytochrome P450 n=1 Tax=Streptosporangium sp. NPDC023825 TaxID=3154909 RepID=UPI0034298B4C
MTSDPLVLSRPAEIRAVLADPRFTVEPVPRPPFALTVAWLRGAVGRFAEGSTHAERRAAAEAVLAGLDPDALRAEAFRLASRDTGGHPCPPEPEPERVPVLVLAVALGVRAEDGPEAVEAVAAIAPAYLPGPGAGPYETDVAAADAGLVRLSRLLGDPAPERLAVVAGLLAQAYGPMTGLVRGALAAAPARCAAGAGTGTGEPPTAGTWTARELLHETLRHDPPVRTLRRRAPGDGRTVVLDVAAAGRDPETPRGPDLARTGDEPEFLAFGAGPRACPGRQVALALAAGTIEAATR